MNASLLRVEGISKAFANPAGGDRIRAVHDISFVLDRGRSLGVLGASGAGKSTLIRILLGIETPDRGTVVFDGVDLHRPRAPRGFSLEGRIQVVFQDPRSSLNPHLRVGTIVAEPLFALPEIGRSERTRRVAGRLEEVGLGMAISRRRPHELSGGERQRVAIARALVTDPEILILDEPVSALDAPIRRQILQLLQSLRTDLELSIIIVSHDVRTIASLTDRVAVLCAGRCVEEGPTPDVLANPREPTTRALVAAADRLSAVLMGEN